MVEINSSQKKRFVFLLLDNFSLISFACAVEPLRLANRYHSSEFYEWKSASEDGKVWQSVQLVHSSKLTWV